MHKAVRIVGWVGLLSVLTLVAIVSAVFITHPRDEAAYVRYVHTYRSYNGEPVAPVAAAELIAAGDRACDWLSHQQPGLWRDRAPYRIFDLSDRYTPTMSAADRAMPASVLPGAWHFLCPGTTLLIRSHQVFEDESD